jgi:hypothetical protein
MRTISFVSHIPLEIGKRSLTLPQNLIEVWKLDDIHPDLQDNVKVHEHAFSFRGTVTLWLIKNVIFIIMWHFNVEREAFPRHFRKFILWNLGLQNGCSGWVFLEFFQSFLANAGILPYITLLSFLTETFRLVCHWLAHYQTLHNPIYLKRCSVKNK